MSDSQEPNRRPPWSLFRFSLRALLLVVLLVAVFLAGRNSNRMFDSGIQPGTWHMVMAGGHEKQVNISRDLDGRFVIGTGGVLSGVYDLSDNQLVMFNPSDARMVGLIWQWDGQALTLVAETPGTPTGSSYVGARMTRLTEKD